MFCFFLSFCNIVLRHDNKQIYYWAVPRENQHYGLQIQISLRNPRRLIRADTFRLRGIEVWINYSWNRKSTGGEKCLSGLACAAYLGWSGSILNAESIMLVFLAERLMLCFLSRNGKRYLYEIRTYLPRNIDIYFIL